MKKHIIALLAIVVMGQGMIPNTSNPVQGQMMGRRVAILNAQKDAARQLNKSHVQFKILNVVFNGNVCTVKGMAQ